MFRVEPARMIIEAKRSTIRLIVAIKVLHQHLVNAILVRRIGAGITHRAPSASQVIPHHHANLPDAGERFSWTRCYHALVIAGVVERKRPERRRILEDGQRGIVCKVRIVQHLKLFVSSALKEWGSHSANIFQLDAAVQMKYLSLAVYLLQPLILRILLAKPMTAY